MPLFPKSEMTTLSLTLGEKRWNLDNAATPLTAIAAWNDVGGGMSSSGEVVTPKTALAISTVYTCTTILAESVASLPCLLMRSAPEGFVQATDSALFNLLTVAPNVEMTAFTFWSTMVGSSALCGAGYAQIERDTAGAPVAFWPLHPSKTEPVRNAQGQLAFKTSDGMSSGTYRIVPSADVLHFPLFSLDGIKATAPVTSAREAFALAKAQEKYGARYFSNGAQAPVVFIKKGEKPDAKAQREFVESWQAAHAGENQHRQGFLFGDWDVKSIGLSPEDSQFLTARNYQRADIAAMYKIPPHMVGDLGRLSNNNYQQQQLSFITDTLRPILSRIEAELKRKLFPKQRDLTVRFDLTERLRGDQDSRMRNYALGRQWGWLSANDCRRAEGLPTIGPEGDTYLTPVNMADSKLLNDPTVATPPAGLLPEPTI